MFSDTPSFSKRQKESPHACRASIPLPAPGSQCMTGDSQKPRPDLPAPTAIVSEHSDRPPPQLDLTAARSPPPSPLLLDLPALLTHEIGNEHSYLMESSLTCTDGMARFAWRICQSLCEAEGRRGMRSESHKRGEICSCVDANRMYEVWLSGRQGARKVARDRQRANEGIIKWNNV